MPLPAMRLPVLSAAVLATLALSACVAEPEERPEPETQAQLRIEDRSTEAPPVPPPSAPPEGAAAMPSAPQPPGQPPAPALPAQQGPSTTPPVVAAPTPAPASVPLAPASVPPAPASVPPAPVSAAPAPVSAAPAPAVPIAQEAPPDSTQWVREYPGGHWVYANGYGWMWVPANASTVEDEGVPYTYLYTPAYGWTWYVSPWGSGPYRYGVWVRRPWHPVGWHGAWVAAPRVTVRFGGHPRYYGRRHRHW